MILFEKLFDTTSEVDALLPRVLKYLNNYKIGDSWVNVTDLISIAKSLFVREAILGKGLNLQVIIGAGVSNSYFNPVKMEIFINVCNPSILQRALRKQVKGYYLDFVSEKFPKALADTTEEHFRYVIGHELGHFVNYSLVFDYSENLFKYRDVLNAKSLVTGKPLLGLVDTFYAETDAQINGIFQVYQIKKDIWDKISLTDLLNMVPALLAIYKFLLFNFPNELQDWTKYLLKRLNKEGFLGKNIGDVIEKPHKLFEHYKRIF